MIKGIGNSAQGCPSLSLALWANAWLRGEASPDAVIDGLSTWAELHLVVPADDVVARSFGIEADSGVVALLQLLRSLPQPAHVALLLPVPGDTRGLTPGAEHTRVATAAGETLLVSTGAPVADYRGIGVVPVQEGRDVLRWAVYGIPARELAPVPQLPGINEARHQLREAVREATALFGRLQTVGSSPTAARARITELTESAHSHRLPGTISPRVAEVLDSAATIAAILTVAGESAIGSQTSTAGSELAEDTLRRLWAVVRDARLAAVQEANGGHHSVLRGDSAPQSAPCPRGGRHH